MASMQNPNLQPTYEDFKALVEQKDTADALLLLVHVPGFTREQIGASFDAAARKLGVFGEKPLDNNKRKRFKEEFVIPETYDSNKLTGKFEGKVITITMPKKPISSIAATIKEPKPAQEAAAGQVTPPTSTSGVEAEREAIKKGEKGVSQEQPKSEMESQRESDKRKDETPSPPKEATRENQMTKKDKEIPQKGIKEEEKRRDEMETKDASTPEKVKGESRMPLKDQEGTPQKGKLDDKKDEEDKKAKNEMIQEDDSQTSEAGKAPQKVQTMDKEARKETGSSGLKTPEKMEKKTDVKTGKANQRKYGTKDRELSIGKGIKDIANTASGAVTRMAERFREEDKQKLLYAGAAILMVAVGIYTSFKLRSTGRQ